MGFSPKNYREPETTIPAKLVTSLKVEREKRDKACGWSSQQLAADPNSISSTP